MKRQKIFLFLFLVVGCNKNETHVLSDRNLASYQLNGISIGNKLEDVYTKFKENIVVQNYKDISDVKECENAKNIIIDNNQTNIDVDESGIITAINTTNPNIVDSNGAKIGQSEKELLKLNSIIKKNKLNNGEDGGYYYEYIVTPTNSKVYYVYTTDDEKKIDYIGLFSKAHIACYED